jgi:hypothetical protein
MADYHLLVDNYLNKYTHFTHAHTHKYPNTPSGQMPYVIHTHAHTKTGCVPHVAMCQYARMCCYNTLTTAALIQRGGIKRGGKGWQAEVVIGVWVWVGIAAEGGLRC